MITTAKPKWKCLLCDSRSGKILGTVYVGGDDKEGAKRAAIIQGKLIGIKRRLKVYARRWSLAEDPRAVASGYVGAVQDAAE